MKNFRKVLALVLVVATLFSFTAMASAKKYEDADKISYDMAVDVLSAVGVLDGYEVAEDEFEFHPTDKITREEMAKMIAVLCNAGDDVSTLYASACNFADVAKDRWSASYVAYCAKTGIVAGRSATTFDPKANVTGLETAKMLLVALGFDAKVQGYVGADWKVNVLRDAKTAGLLKNFAASYDIEAAITREEAAQMMLNTLLGNVVIGYLSDASRVVVTNKLYSEDYDNMAWTLIDAKGTAVLYGKVVISDDKLSENLFPGLTISYTQAKDCYGRTAASFTYVKKGITVAQGSYALNAGDFYTTQVDLSAEYKAQKNTEKYGVKIINDGNVNHASYTAAQWAAAAAEVARLTGNGTETYITTSWDASKDEGTITVNVAHTFIGKVANIDNYAKEFDIVDATAADGSVHVEVQDVKIVDAVKAGDFVLYHMCHRENHKTQYGAYASDIWSAYAPAGVHDYAVVTPVQAKVDYSRDYAAAGHINKCFVTSTEGKTFYYNNWVGSNYAAADKANYTELEAGKSYNLYLDKYGYVMLTAAVGATKYVAYIEEGSEYPIVTDSTWNNGWIDDTAAGLKAAVYTGSDVENVALTDIKTEEEENLFGIYDLLYSEDNNGALVQYTVDAYGFAHPVDGVYTKYVAAGQVIKSTTKSVATNNVAGGTNFGLNADTVFMIRSTDYATGEWSYEEIVGVGNLPKAYAVVPSTHTNATTGVVTADDNGTNAQFLDLNGDAYADYVFIDAKYTSSAAEFIVMAERVQYTASWTGTALVGKYDAYRALVNGKDAIVLYKAADTSEPAVLKRGRLYKSALALNGVAMVYDNELPLYVAADLADNTETALKAQKGTIKISLDSAKNVSVKFIDNTGKNQFMTGIEEVPVYHLTGYGLANAYSGYWVETNNVTYHDTLGTDLECEYVVKDAVSGKVTAIYVIHVGYQLNAGSDVLEG